MKDSDGGLFTMKSVLLNGVLDLPAKCLVQNMIQFNGEHGCSLCEIEVQLSM